MLHNGDIIADGYVRPLKPQAAKGAKSADGAAEAGAEAAPAEGAAADSATEKVCPHLKHLGLSHTCSACLHHVMASKLAEDDTSFTVRLL